VPPLKIVVMVEHLIGESVWTKPYYNDDGSTIQIALMPCS
jgi:hypothetical protein